MKVLQLCSYYVGNKLYQKMFEKIEEENILQDIYIPIKNKNLINRNVFSGDGASFYYDPILKKLDRLLYARKVKKQMKRIQLKVTDLKSTRIIHAHTLFSDGGTAYLLNKKYGIKYMINIRNTDINVFYKYAIHHRSYAHRVLRDASAIVFISPAYKEKTINLLPEKLVKQIEGKMHVIPNGIDDKWLVTGIPSGRKKLSGKIHFLFTGTLDKNKNLISVLKLMKKFHDEGKDVYLNVAGDGLLKNKLINSALKMGLKEKVKFHGKLSQEELLLLTDQSDIFILPSYRETFGISYIESMSRGLPVIYTRNEGIDGYFPDGSIGYSTTPDNIMEMKKNVHKILMNYEQISQRCIDESHKFNWTDISNTYIDLYENINNTRSLST